MLLWSNSPDDLTRRCWDLELLSSLCCLTSSFLCYLGAFGWFCCQRECLNVCTSPDYWLLTLLIAVLGAAESSSLMEAFRAFVELQLHDPRSNQGQDWARSPTGAQPTKHTHLAAEINTGRNTQQLCKHKHSQCPRSGPSWADQEEGC